MTAPHNFFSNQHLRHNDMLEVSRFNTTLDKNQEEIDYIKKTLSGI